MQTVSVIIPTNRGGPYLREAVASVASQTSPVTEIILVDDGSPAPGLAEVASELGIRYLRQNAAGIAVARNTGVAAAIGDWVTFIDDDDVWHPQRVEWQLTALTREPGAIAAYTGGWYVDAHGVRFGEGWPAPPATKEELLSGRVPFPRITTLLVRRDTYSSIGGCRSTMEPSEDNDLMLRLLTQGPFVAVNHPLVGYRRHASNVTRRGLNGRIAGRRSIVHGIDTAQTRSDATTAALLESNLRAFLLAAAAENMGELISAVRGHDWAYASKVAWWGLTRAPVESLRAARERLARRQR